MARQEMLMARCDRKECKTVVEIERSTEAPDGWLEVRVEIEGKFDGRSKMEFCSARCVSIWARDRNKVVESHNGNGNGNGNRDYKEEVIAAIEILFANNETEFTVPEVSNVADINPTTVRGYIRKLEAEGMIKQIRGTGQKGDPLTYAKV